MSYVVVGFYTPNYAEIAKTFCRSLTEHSIPHKLYAVERLGGSWQAQTLRKPEIALRALDEHPDKSIILMDVDCSVHGDLSPLVEAKCDVALYPYKNKRTGAMTVSTRAVVFHQTPGARRLLAEWHEKCDEAICQALTNNVTSWKRRALGVSDETRLHQAIEDNPSIVVAPLPASYSGNSDSPGALVTHESAHDRFTLRDRLKMRIKKIRRRVVERMIGQQYKEWKYGIK